MYLNLSDQGISRELALKGIRENNGVEIMRKILKPGHVVVDIGANIGFYALFESKLVGSDGKVYAIEPVTENINLLRRNVDLNHCKNIEIFHYAIGSTDTTSQIYLSDKSNWHSMIQRNQQCDTQNVNVLKLDTFLKNKLKPTFIRMDLEGYELEVVKGMLTTLKECQQLVVFIEVHPHIMNRKDVITLLKIFRENDFEIHSAANREKIYITTIDRLLRDDGFLNGKKGGQLVFFEKRIRAIDGE